jgi:DNA-binding transcriptional regulator YiaG
MDSIDTRGGTLTSEDVKDLRRELGLSVAQLGMVLGVAAATVESWESGARDPTIDQRKISGAMRSKFLRAPKQGNNLLPGGLTIGGARDLLKRKVEDVAAEFGYSVATWRSFEQGRRHLPDEVRDGLMKLVEMRLKEIDELAP